MKNRLPSLLFTLLFWISGLQAQHTFSIVAIDPMTGGVGSAGATCLNNSSCGGCGGAIIISGLIPGKGAANAQATVCIPNVNLNSILSQMDQGNSAPSCLNTVLIFDGCQAGDTSNRQYGIVTIDTGNAVQVASFTGSNALNHAGHRSGPNYSIQGNILLGPQILDSMEAGFLNTPGPLCEKLMAALQGANVPGADSRCLGDSVSSQSAFIRIARPGDSPGNFWMDLNVPELPQGREPIDSLQTLFDAFKAQMGLPASPDPARLLLYPNPSSGHVRLDFARLDPVSPSVDLYDLRGRHLRSIPLSAREGVCNLDLRPYAGNAAIFLVYRDPDANGGLSLTRKLFLF